MDSAQDLPKGRGFPIRTSADQRSLASPRGFSQRATSFIASRRQGIHRTPLSCSGQNTRAGHAQQQPTPTDATQATTNAAATDAHRCRRQRRRTTREHDRATQTAPSRHANTSNPDSRCERTSRRRHPATTRQAAAAARVSKAGKPAEHRRHRARHTHGACTPAGRGPGGDRVRTDDPLLAKQVLSQLSYAPAPVPSRPSRPAAPAGMGQGGLEPPTPRLSSVCSNQLSYWPGRTGRARPAAGPQASSRQGQSAATGRPGRARRGTAARDTRARHGLEAPASRHQPGLAASGRADDGWHPCRCPAPPPTAASIGPSPRPDRVHLSGSVLERR